MSLTSPFMLICFDLDDTLWPCMPTILRAENKLYQWFENNKPAVSQQYSLTELRQQRLDILQQQPEYQYNLSALRKASFKNLALEFGYSYDWIEEAFEVFYAARQQVSFFDDVEPVLKRLKTDYKIASMTNGNADIHQTSLGHLFDYAISAEQVGAVKPDARMFQALLQQSGLSADQILFVGDHPVHDIEGASQQGMTSVWLNRQAEKWSHDSVQPNHIFNDLFELDSYLATNV